MVQPYSVEVVGDRNLVRELNRMPVIVQKIMREKFDLLSVDMAEELRTDIDNKTDGTGAMAESVEAYVTESGGTIQLFVGFDGSVAYAKIQDRGGSIPAHMIYPKKGKVLAFMGIDGRKAFATRIFHPGATIRPQNFLKDLRRKFAARISKEMKAAVINGLRANMRGIK